MNILITIVDFTRGS